MARPPWPLAHAGPRQRAVYADVLARALGGAAVANNPLEPATSSQGNNCPGRRAPACSPATPDRGAPLAGDFRQPTHARPAIWLCRICRPVGFICQRAMAAPTAPPGMCCGVAAMIPVRAGNQCHQWQRRRCAGSAVTPAVCWVRYSACEWLGPSALVPNLPAFGLTPAGIVHRAGGDQRPAHLAAIPSSTSWRPLAQHNRCCPAPPPDAASQQALRPKRSMPPKACWVCYQYPGEPIRGSNGVQKRREFAGHAV